MKKRIGTYNGKPLVVGDKNLLNKNEIHSDAVAGLPEMWGIPVLRLDPEDSNGLQIYIIVDKFGSFPKQSLYNVIKENKLKLSELQEKESLTEAESLFLNYHGYLSDHSFILYTPQIVLSNNIIQKGDVLNKYDSPSLSAEYISEISTYNPEILNALLSACCICTATTINQYECIEYVTSIKSNSSIGFKNISICNVVVSNALSQDPLNFNYCGYTDGTLIIVGYSQKVLELIMEIEQELSPSTYTLTRNKSFEELKQELLELHKDKIEVLKRAYNIKKLRENG